jgi:hypothetical protein
MTKNLRISDAAYERLTAITRPGETLSDAFDRVIGECNPFAGLGDVLASPEAAEQIDLEYRSGLPRPVPSFSDKVPMEGPDGPERRRADMLASMERRARRR